ncbi:MAG: hypothetical protein DCC55_02215 [Chloroflexi bacterium]|nr:MAG: hypothetical protein DCC55_02215 [Chloroflexota bacterium]
MWYNPIIALILRSPLHGMLSSGIMVVTYIGRKSGRTISVPVSYVRDDEDGNVLWTTSLRKRTWWRNLRGEALVTLRLRGKNRPARAEALEDEDEVADALYYYLTLTPSFAKHFDVALDEEGEPVEEDLVRAAQKRVVVRFNLQ